MHYWWPPLLVQSSPAANQQAWQRISLAIGTISKKKPEQIHLKRKMAKGMMMILVAMVAMAMVGAEDHGVQALDDSVAPAAAADEASKVVQCILETFHPLISWPLHPFLP